MDRTRRRLGVAVTAAALVVAVIGVANVRASPSLPPVPAKQLLTSSLSALAQPFTISGDALTRLDLGLPQLPSSIGASTGASAALALVTGDQRFRVWRSPDGVRVAHLLQFREQDLVANHREAWFWDSQTMVATHATFPSSPEANAPPVSPGDVTAIASKLLAGIAPYADITVDGTATVAGRPCYELVLAPRSSTTRIGRITVAIDAETRLPLRFQIFARGADAPAVEGAFTSVSFDPIDPAMFTFTPPPGATVTEVSDAGAAHGWTGDGPVSGVRVFGDGFDLRVAFRLDATPPREVASLLPYAGPLASAILIDRGDHVWLLVGFVDVATLQEDASSLR